MKPLYFALYLNRLDMVSKTKVQSASLTESVAGLLLLLSAWSLKYSEVGSFKLQYVNVEFYTAARRTLNQLMSMAA